jgi:hypothetical protein
VEQLREKLAGSSEELESAKAEIVKLMKLSNPNAKIQHMTKMKEDYNKVLKDKNNFYDQLEAKKRKVAMLEKQMIKGGANMGDLRSMAQLDEEKKVLEEEKTVLEEKLQKEAQKKDEVQGDLQKVGAALAANTNSWAQGLTVEAMLQLAAGSQKKQADQERIIKKQEGDIFLLSRKKEGSSSRNSIGGANVTAPFGAIA